MATIECMKCGKRYMIDYERWKYGEIFTCYGEGGMRGVCLNERFKLIEGMEEDIKMLR